MVKSTRVTPPGTTGKSFSRPSRAVVGGRSFWFREVRVILINLCLCSRLIFAPSSYRMLQESSSSHNIPHSVPSSSTEKLGISSLHHSPLPPPHQMLSYSMSNSSDLAGGGGGGGNLSSPSHSMSTPQFKKKFIHDGMGSKSGSTGLKDGSGLVSKHESFDYPGSELFVH